MRLPSCNIISPVIGNIHVKSEGPFDKASSPKHEHAGFFISLMEAS